MRKIFDKKIWQPAVPISLLTLLIVGGFVVNFYRIQKAHGSSDPLSWVQLVAQSAPLNVRGWLYSENMGWLNTNCYNDYNNDGTFECCCPGGPSGENGQVYCPSNSADCPYAPNYAAGYYGLQADIGASATNQLRGYAYAENYQNWSNSSTLASTLADGNRGYICFGADCGGTAPDSYPAWACVGTRQDDGSCLQDCGQEFNYDSPIINNGGNGGNQVNNRGACTAKNTIVDSDLVGHWTFDNVNNIPGTTRYLTPDTSGNGLDARLGPGTYPTSTPLLITGNFKQDTAFTAAFSYDTDANVNTVNQVYAVVPDNSLLHFSHDFTLEGWVYLKDGGHYNSAQIMLRKDHAYALGVIPSTYDKFAAELFLNGGWQSYYFSDANFAANYVNKWRHVAMTYDGHYVRLYLDGVLDRVYLQASPDVFVGPASPLYLGGDPDLPATSDRDSIAPATAYLNGYLDNVAIYSRVKTADELWLDAHKEVTGWAKIETGDTTGWINLHDTTAVANATVYSVYKPNDWPAALTNEVIQDTQEMGMYLNNHSQGGNYYTLGGRYNPSSSYYDWRTWAWGSDDSLGWLTGTTAYGHPHPQAFDSFNVVNINPIQEQVATQLNWSASRGATSYIFWRAQDVNNNNCTSGCTFLPYPVPYYACTDNQCTTNDTYWLSANLHYCYKMQAWNWDGSTWNTNNPPTYPLPYCLTTTPPEPSSDVLVDGNVCGQLQVIWQPTTDEQSSVDGYNLYRSLSNTPGVGCNSSLTDPACTLIAHVGEGIKSGNLSAQWRMDESSWSGNSNEVIDSSGNQNHGTASGSGANTTSTAKFIRSGDFTGGYVTVADASSLDFTANDSFTISGWVNTRATSGDMDILYKYNKPNGSGYEVMLTSGAPTCHFLKNPGHDVTLTSSKTINDGAWHYIACVGNRTSGLLKIFVDNNFDSSTADISKLGDISNNYNVIIGEGFTGLLDNWAVIKAARSHTDLLLEAESQPLTGICNNTTDQQFNYGTNGTSLACSSSECCIIKDQRANPNSTYYYWLTQTAGGVGESSAKAPQSGCQSVGNSKYRYGCDKTVCQPRTQTKEK